MHGSDVILIEHPVIAAKLAELRAVNTGPRRFRSLLDEIAALMLYEITRDWPTQPRHVDTPLEQTVGQVLAREVTLVPILRAGLGMLDGVLRILPDARVGHLGVYRDEKTLAAVTYLRKLPADIASTEVILLDPMLATGGSACAAIGILKDAGLRSLRFVCLVAAPQGVATLRASHPEVPVYCAAIDRELNEKGYILPGLGDAGDRMFGTG